MSRARQWWKGAWFPALLAALILTLYLPALRFGLIWDDPRYYQKVSEQATLGQIFTSPQPPTYQFYRPMAVLYAHLFLAPNGVVNAPLAHALQITAHLLVSLSLAPVLRAFRFDAIHARLAALCFAIYPLSYYGVAWQQNQQPWVVLCLLLALLAARRFCESKSAVFLGLSLAAYATALLFQEGAAPFVFLFFWLAWECRETQARPAWWPLLHAGLVALYTLIWLTRPIQPGVTGQGFQPIVLTYFMQGLVFPVARSLSGWLADWPLTTLFALFTGVWLLLSFGLWQWGARRAVLLGGAWAAVGLLPLWAGLSWDYAQSGARLFYPAAVGLAALWGGWMAWAFTAPGRRRRIAGAITLVAVVGVSLHGWWQFQRLFQVGTQHLAHAVDELSASPNRRLLFVNFPDRIEIRPAPYPLGFWGLILAPVVQDLSDYARAAHGQSGTDRSLSSFVTGAGDRDTWPYFVNMRGVDADPNTLFNATLESDAVYLSEYQPGGALRLREVGSARPSVLVIHPMARFGEAVQLLSAELQPTNPLRLRLIWRCLKPLQPDDTILVHFWKDGAFVGEADGDSLGGLIPPWAWQPGAEVVDGRLIETAGFEPGVYEVRVGLYNRASGVRYPSIKADGGVEENGAWIGEFRVP